VETTAVRRHVHVYVVVLEPMLGQMHVEQLQHVDLVHWDQNVFVSLGFQIPFMLSVKVVFIERISYLFVVVVLRICQ
jgi:hypothetical protein